MKNSTVSIIIPVFNASRYIIETLESVLRQTFEDWELMLIDDGSTDDSVEVIKQFICSLGASAILLDHPEGENRGTSASRNLGLQHATGDLVCFLDADDVWAPDFLSFFTEKFRNHEDLVMAYSPCIYWHSNTGGTQDKLPDSIQVTGIGPDRFIDPEVLFRLFLDVEDTVPSPSGVMMRRAAVNRVGGWDEGFPGMYDDQVLYSKLLLSGGRVYLAEKPLYFYRQHEESLCQIALRDERLYENRKEYLTWLREFLEQRPAGCKSLVEFVDAHITLLEVKNLIDVHFSMPTGKLKSTGKVIASVWEMLGDNSSRFSYKVFRYGTGYFVAKFFNLGNKI